MEESPLRPPNSHGLRFDAEANIQAELYHQARMIGLPACLEVSTPAGRHDLVILNRPMTHFLAIIECKRNEIDQHTKQLERYRKLGVPVFIVTNADNTRHFIASLASHLAGSAGVPISTIASMRHLKEERLARRKYRRLARVPKLDPDLLVKGYNPWT